MSTYSEKRVECAECAGPIELSWLELDERNLWLSEDVVCGRDCAAKWIRDGEISGYIVRWRTPSQLVRRDYAYLVPRYAMVVGDHGAEVHP